MGGSLNVLGAIEGLGYSLTKAGTGTLLLSGTNTYTGATSVDFGTLLVNGDITSSSGVSVDGTLGGSGTVPSVSISTIGTLSPGNSPGILYTGDLAFTDSGSTYFVEINGATVGSEYDRTDVTGTVTLANATLSLSFGFTPAIGDTFTIINNDGSDAIGGTFNGLAEGSTITFGAAELTISYAGGSNSNDVVLTVIDVTYTWDGGGGNDSWSTAANWVGDVAPTDGSNLVFPSGAARLTNNNDLVGLSFHSITFAGAGYNITGSAITLTEGISATYVSGTTTFGLGTTLAGNLTIDVSAGGTLDLSGAIVFDSGGNLRSVTKNGGGTLRYSGSTENNYNGGTTINAGTLVLAKADDVISSNGNVIVGDNTSGASLQVLADNQFWVGSNVTVNEGSTFDVGSYLQHISNLNLQGSAVQIDAGGVLYLFVGVNTYATTNDMMSVIQGLGALEIDNSSNTFTIDDDAELAVELSISTIIQGQLLASGITKDGPGTVALSGDNTFGGDVTVNTGAIQVESNGALGTTDGGTTIANGASVLFDGLDLLVTEAFTIQGTGLAGVGVLFANSGSATLTGFTVMLGDSQIGAADDATLTLNGQIDDTDVSAARNLTVTNGATGRTVLGAQQRYDGSLTVTAGYLRATSYGAFLDPGTSNSTTIQDGATLELSGGLSEPAIHSVILNGDGVGSGPKLVNVDGDNTLLGVITFGGDGHIDVAEGTTLTLNGVISETGGSRPIIKTGPGTLALRGANIYSGGTTVNGGFLEVFNSESAGMTGTLAMNTGTTLVLSTDNFLLPSGGLTLADSTTVLVPSGGIISLDGAITLTGNTTFNISLSTLDVNGAIGGSFGLTKTGNGSLNLNATSTYTGPTTVSEGVLLVFGDTSSSSLVTIGTSSIFAGTGTAGSIVGTGGTLYGGDPFGMFQTGSVSLNSESVFAVIIVGSTVGQDYGQVVSSGPVNLGGASLQPMFGELGYIPQAGDVLTILDNTSSSAISGTFANLAEGDNVDISGFGYRISYVGGTGNDITLTAIGATTTQVSSNSATTTYGDQITFTALVSAGDGSPTGLVMFYDGSAIPDNLIGSAMLNNMSMATITTSLLSASGSPHSIIAVYAGTDFYYGSTSPAFSQTVNRASLTVTANDQSKLFGAAVPTLTASYSGFVNGETSANLTTQPTLSTTATSSSPVAGSPYTINASGASSSNYTINYVAGQLDVTPMGTTTLVDLSTNPSLFGQVVTFTATVSASDPNAGTPAGMLVVFVNGTTNQTVALDESGQATGQLTFASAGSYSLSFQYQGESNFAASNFAVQDFVVDPAATVSSVIASSNSSAVGQPVTFTALVSTLAPGSGTPTGTVAFFDGSTLLGSANLVNGSASLTLSSLTSGSHSIRAAFAGSDNFASSSSSILPFNVSNIPGDYDGDGTADLATYEYIPELNSGRFDILLSGGGTLSTLMGVQGDIVVVGDFDGDGRSDMAVFSPNFGGDEANWIIQRSSDGVRQVIGFGAANLVDLPAPADYDGDGITDIATFRSNSELVANAAQWFIRPSTDPTAGYTVIFGASDGIDMPVPADYDGDGKADIATFRANSDLSPGNAEWFILPSGNQMGGYSVAFGGSGGMDVPVPADFNGDGMADIATFRSNSDLSTTSSQWFILPSNNSGSASKVDLGEPGSVDAAGDYDGNGAVDLGTLDRVLSQWRIRSLDEAEVRSTTFGPSGNRVVPVLASLDNRLKTSQLEAGSPTASSLVDEAIAGLGRFNIDSM